MNLEYAINDKFCIHFCFMKTYCMKRKISVFSQTDSQVKGKSIRFLMILIFVTNDS
jgi:hypothetical protein